MLRDPQKPVQPNPQPDEIVAAKPRRFRIVKLEERIAPGGGHGNGSNYSCGGECNGGGNSNKHCGK